MAKIKGSEIIDLEGLAAAIGDVKAAYEGLNQVIIKDTKEAQEVVDNATADNIKSVNALLNAQKKVDANKKAALQLDKQLIEVQQKEAVAAQKIAQEKQKTAQQEQKTTQQRLKDEEALRQAQLKTINQETRNAEQQKRIQERQEKANAKLKKDLADQSNAFKRLTTDTNKAQAEFKRLAAEFGVNSREATKARKTFEVLDDKLREVNTAARDGRRDVGRYETAFKNVRKTFISVATTFGAGLGIAQIFRSGIQVITDFNTAQTDLLAISGKNAEELAGLTAQAKELGATTQFTASEITGLQIELSKLGFSVEEIQQSTGGIANFAAAVGVEIPRAAALGGAAVRAFGLEASDIDRVVSTLAVATTKSALDFQKLENSLSTVAPVANAFGFSIEDTTALLGQLANAGFDASSAATATRNILLNLADANGALAQELGRPITGAEDLAFALQELDARGVDLAQSLELTDKRSVAAFQTFIGGSDSLVQLRDSITGADDELRELAEKRLDSVEGQYKLLQSAIEGVILGTDDAIGVSEALKNTLGFLAENINSIVQALGIAIGVFTGYKTIVVASTVAQTAYNAVTKTAAVVTRAWTVAQTALNVVLSLNPIGLVVLAIGALTAGIIALVNIFPDLTSNIKKAFSSWENFKDALIDVGFFLLKIIDPLGIVTGLLQEQEQSTKKLTEEEEKRLAVARRTQVVNEQALGIGKQILSQQKDEIQNAQILLDALESENVSREDKQKILDRLQAQYPEILGNIELETLKSEDLIKVKKALTAQILEDAIARREQEEIAKRTNEIIEIEIQRVIKNNATLGQARLDQLNNEIKLIGLIKNRITSELGNISENLDLTGGFDRLTDELTRVNEALEKATDPEKIAKLNRERDDLIKQQERLLGLGNELNQQNKEANEIRSSGESSREKEIQDAKDLSKEIEEINRKQEEDELKSSKKRNEAAEKAAEEERKRVEEQNRITFEAEQEQFEAKKKKEAQEKKDAEDAKKRREQEIKELKEFAQDQIEIFKDITKAVQDRRQSEIEALNESIGERQTEVSRLEELALAGNQAAAESLAAEKDAIERERNEIDSLEKKKQNLQITILALSTAQSLLDQGDSNALTNADSLIRNFIENIPQLYTGTPSTLADMFGRTGTRDGHFVRLHDTEHVIGAEQSSKLHAAGLNKTSDIVESALAHHNNDNGKKMMGLKRPNQFNDSRIVSRLESVEKAINNIEIPEHYYDFLNMTEMIKKGNTTKLKKFETGIIRFS